MSLDKDWKVIGTGKQRNPINRLHAREPRLRHLHLGIYREPKGSDDRTMAPSSTIMLWIAGDVSSQRNLTECYHKDTDHASTHRSGNAIAPLLVGARLVMARPGGHQDGGYLAELIGEQEITGLTSCSLAAAHASR